MAFIRVDHVSKHFRVPRRAAGFKAAVASFFHREEDLVKAVDDVDFSIERGELVGYIGPNGAGKSTTIKMLSGILLPTAGRIEVDGLVPYENRKENARRIGVVFGQRSSLEWDLPVVDTFDLYRRIYRIEPERFKKNVDFFVDLLELSSFLERPVRNLSLGQKIRANIAVSLLHDPSILYLDEPTIGLDVVAKAQIRKFVRAFNREKGTTLMLTTHDMADIEKMCDRIVMIDKGRKLFDGSMESFRARFGGEYVVRVVWEDEASRFVPPNLKPTERTGPVELFQGDRATLSIPQALGLFLAKPGIADIQVQEIGIEDIVRRMYRAAGSTSEESNASEVKVSGRPPLL